MKWLDRFRRKVPEQAGGPEEAVLLPPAIYQAVARRARRLGVKPAVLASDLLREAIEHRCQVESVKGHWKSLSPREKEIARLAASGLSNPQIANQLCIAPDTVKNHIRSALHKLHLPGKAQLREALEGMEPEEKGRKESPLSR